MISDDENITWKDAMSVDVKNRIIRPSRDHVVAATGNYTEAGNKINGADAVKYSVIYQPGWH